MLCLPFILPNIVNISFESVGLKYMDLEFGSVRYLSKLMGEIGICSAKVCLIFVKYLQKPSAIFTELDSELTFIVNISDVLLLYFFVQYMFMTSQV